MIKPRLNLKNYMTEEIDMKRRSLLVVVVLLCVASLMAAMAYTSAKVTSGAEIKITNTNEALLALVSGGGNDNDSTFEVRDGEGYFKIGKGYNGNNYGFQPNSHYEYQWFMHVDNNSSEKVEFWTELEGFGAAKDFISIQLPGGAYLVKNGVSVAKQVLSPRGQGVDQWDYLRHITLIIDIPSSVDNAKVAGLVSSLQEGNVIFHSDKAK